MVRFGIRLSLRGGQEAIARLAVVAGGVILGVGMLLVTLATLNAVNAQNARYAWLETGSPGAHSRAGAAAADPLWWLLSADEFHGQVIGRVDLATTGPHSPVPPGIPRVPGPGEFYASPALQQLLRTTPPAELGDRYLGTQVGTIGSAALPAPDSLLIIVGHTPQQMAAVAGAKEVDAVSMTRPSSCGGAGCNYIGLNGNSIDLILAVVAVAILFPVLIFIATATRLSAARRDQRFAAMRLVGASPRQISVISAVESTVAAAIGVLGGFGLFFASRPSLASIPFTGSPFYVSDLSLNAVDVAAVALGVPLAAAIAARIALRHVNVSPLGVSRRATPRSPSPWRVLTLVAGLGELTNFVVVGRPATTPGQIQAFVPGMLLTMVGLVLTGPWLTMVGSRILAARARRPSALIAARRLADNPHSAFRSLSGLVLAMFVSTVAVCLITTIEANKGSGPTTNTAADRSTLVDLLTDFDVFPPQSRVAMVPTGLLNQLAADPGVTAVTVIHAAPLTADLRQPQRGVVLCADLARTPALGRCARGAVTASIYPGLGPAYVWPRSPIPPSAIDSRPVMAIAVATNGSASAIERARTSLQLAFPYRDAPVTITEDNTIGNDSRRTAGYQRLADVIVLTSLPIAGCTLAAGIVAGINDRKKPFSLLRLTGAPLTVLRRVVALESAVPLLILSGVAVGAGFLTAFLFLNAQLSEGLRGPSGTYYGALAAGLLASLALICSTLPVLSRITGPETARNE